MKRDRQKNIFLSLRKVQFLTLLSIAMVCICAMPLNAAAKSKNPRYAAFVMDADTGLILHQENAGKALYPASLTKMMTLLMVFDALEKGQLKLNDRVRFSKHAASMQPSKLGVKAGGSISVEDAIYALVTKSANDAAAAVGEKIGGSESNFALMMTNKAHAIGMKSTTFRNASGLHDKRQVTTARDMARLSLVLIRDYAKYYPYFSTKSFTFQGTPMRNHNRLMSTYKGMDGLKTGYIAPSGFNLAASAKRGDRRLIGVVFGGQTTKSRNDRMAQLLDDGFAKIGAFNIAQSIENVPVPQQKPIFVAGLGQVYAQGNAPQTQEIEDMTGKRMPRANLLDASNENSILNRMIGQGDYDTAARSRLETGIMAIAAISGEHLPPSFYDGSDAATSPKKSITNASYEKKAAARTYTTNQGNEWAIQIGAFSNRDSTNVAINNSLKKLPASLRTASPVIAPLQADDGTWLFRGRLSGYDRNAALKACEILKDCLPIAPHGQK